LDLKITILSDVPVSPNLSDGKDTCAFVQLAKRAGGEPYLAYRRGSAKHGPDGAFVMQRTSDGVRTWSDPLTIFDRTHLAPPESVVCGGIAVVDETLVAAVKSLEMLSLDVYVFGEEAESFPHYVSLLLSGDSGETWTEPRRIDISPFGGARTGVATNPFVLPNGSLCLPLEVQLDCGPQATAAVVTPDLGNTFSHPHLLVGDETGQLCLCDARVTQLHDQSFLMHLWTFTCDGEQTMEVHQSRSTYGLHWTPALPTGIHGQISAPLEVSPGFIIAVCNHREPPEGNQLWWSGDGGETWNDQPIQMWDVTEGRMLGTPSARRSAVSISAVWDSLPSFSFGSPGMLLLDDGAVLLTYYATIDGIIHARACQFRLS